MILIGDCSEKLKEIESESVDCVVTSPPYFLQRDYGVDKQIGLEHTVSDYVTALADVFDEVKRVLKTSGSLYVNLGDRYATQSGTAFWVHKGKTLEEQRYNGLPIRDTAVYRKDILYEGGAKAVEKCLMKIPDRVAIEMINRGWILRNEIIWDKPNGLPFPTQDRFVQNFEKIFFFVKNKKYYHKIQTEPAKTDQWERNIRGSRGVLGNPNSGRRKGENEIVKSPTRRKRAIWSIPTTSGRQKHTATFPEGLVAQCLDASCPDDGIVLDPFAGFGTTGTVAKKRGLNFILIELNPEYLNPELMKPTTAVVGLDNW